MSKIVADALAQVFSDIEMFSRHILRRPLRDYQVEAIRPVVASVLARDGEEYVWRFPRQSGKNETVAHLDAYLLFVFQRVAGASIIHTAPTADPQGMTAINRVVELTAGNPFFKKLMASGNTLTLGKASLTVISGMVQKKPRVGSTVSLLLQKDEAQDLDQAYIEKTFDPMTSNTNAPQLYTGTARHDQTYLAKKRKALERKTRRDNRQRVFIVNWRDVARSNPAYGQRVENLIAEKGAQHPVVVSEFENIETESTGKLFDQRRLGLMFESVVSPDSRSEGLVPDPASRSENRNGDRGRTRTEDRGTRHHSPQPRENYVATIDVGGTTLTDDDPHKHDPTVIYIHRVTTDAAGLIAFQSIDCMAMPAGANVLDDTADRAKLIRYLQRWKPVRIVTDATGLGIALASALIARFGESVVTPLVLSESAKSELLDAFLALVETSRYQHFTDALDASPDPRSSGLGTRPEDRGGAIDIDAARCREQFAQCVHDQRGRFTHYSVPTDTKWTHPITAAPDDLHDDHMLAVIYLGALANMQPPQPYTAPAVEPAPEEIRRHGKY